MNFEDYLNERLKDPKFAKQFEKARRALHRRIAKWESMPNHVEVRMYNGPHGWSWSVYLNDNLYADWDDVPRKKAFKDANKWAKKAKQEKDPWYSRTKQKD